MLASKNVARTTGTAGPSVRLVAPHANSTLPLRRGGVQCQAIEFSDAFKAALSTALERQTGGGATTTTTPSSYSNGSRDSSYSNDSSSSSSGGGGRFASYLSKNGSSGSTATAEHNYSRSEPVYERTSTYQPSPAAAAEPSTYQGRERYVPPEPVGGGSAGPLMQILATALGQSRATLERLQGEEAEIENLIQHERKQVERLEWLLQKVQGDYSYFDALQKRFEQQNNNGGGGRGY